MNVRKRLLAAACALTMVFGGGALIPEGFDLLGSSVSVSAANAESDFTYYVDYEGDDDNPGACFITGYNGTSASVVIPDTLNGYRVTRIGDYVFQENKKITSVVLGKYVTSVGYEAFYGCEKLKSFDASASALSFIDSEAFYGCKVLSTVKLPETLRSIGSYAFYNCPKLLSVTVPAFTTLGGKAVGLYEAYSSIGDYEYDAVPDGFMLNCVEGTNAAVYASEFRIPCTTRKIADSEKFLTSENSDGTLTVSEYYDKNASEIVIPATIGGKTVSGCDSFGNYPNLTKLTFSNGIKRIGGVYGCPKLTTIALPASAENIDYIGEDCPALTTITVASGCTNYCSYDGVLYYNEEVYDGDYWDEDLGDWVETTHYEPRIQTVPQAKTSIKLKKDLKYLTDSGYHFRNIQEFSVESGSESFKAVDGVLYSADGKTLERYPVGKDVSFASGVTAIGRYAFANNEKFTSLTVPATVTSIGDYAFYCCPKLKTVSLPSKLTEIGYSAFNSCSALTSVTIPNTVTYIGYYAFSSCEKLSSVTLPNKLTSIDSGTFNNCSALKSITIPDSVTYISDSAFSYCTKLSSVTLPSKLTEIGYEAFAYCPALKTIKIPDSVTYIGSWAFTSSGLESVTLPKKLKTIEYSAFYRTELKSVTLPEGLESVGEYAFCNVGTSKWTEDSDGNSKFTFTPSLKNVTIPKSVKTIGEKAFGYSYNESTNKYTKVSGYKINCYTGSAGEKYAKNNSLSYSAFLTGGKVTIPSASYDYRGRGVKPSVTVKNSAGTKLVKDEDYTVSYSNNTAAGTATITVKGKGKYTGTLTKTFKVAALSLKSSNVKVSIPYASYEYSGSAIKPTVKVKYGSSDVIPASDYTVTYSNNTKVGKATITIKGKGTNVKDTVTKTFVIKPKPGTLTLTTTKGAFKASWTKNSSASGYEVVYSKDKNFKSGVTTYNVSKNTTTSVNFSSKPKSGETWYVKYRAYVTVNGTKYGNYSSVKSIKVK